MSSTYECHLDIAMRAWQIVTAIRTSHPVIVDCLGESAIGVQWSWSLPTRVDVGYSALLYKRCRSSREQRHRRQDLITASHVIYLRLVSREQRHQRQDLITPSHVIYLRLVRDKTSSLHHTSSTCAWTAAECNMTRVTPLILLFMCAVGLQGKKIVWKWVV